MRVLITLIVLYVLILLGLAFLRLATIPTAEPEATATYPYNKGINGWIQDINRWSRQYEVPGNIIRAIMIQESGGNSRLITDAGNGLKAYGLMQVVDYSGRFAEWEDPLDVEVNMRESMKFLRGCNRIYSGGKQNWVDKDIVYKTAQCYFDGPNGTWTARTRRYGRNILSLAGIS